ncbi:hypothetical protein ACT7TX_003484 [Vibrio cholerae]
MQEKKNKLAGSLFIIILTIISMSTAISFIGNNTEKIITFLSQFVTLLVVVGLFCAWQNTTFISKSFNKFISIAYPTLTVLASLYPILEYSEQTIPSTYIYFQSLQIILSLIIASILLKESKR